MLFPTASSPVLRKPGRDISVADALSLHVASVGPGSLSVPTEITVRRRGGGVWENGCGYYGVWRRSNAGKALTWWNWLSLGLFVLERSAGPD